MPPSTGNAAIPLSYIPYYTGEKRKGIYKMKKELGIARCGLACCLCSENGRCGGCDSGDCPGAGNCENRACSISRRLRHCYECPDVENCRKGKLSDPRIYGFTHFARVYGENCLLACLARNEEAGIRYHRQGLKGDYDGFPDAGALARFIRSGESS